MNKDKEERIILVMERIKRLTIKRAFGIKNHFKPNAEQVYGIGLMLLEESGGSIYISQSVSHYKKQIIMKRSGTVELHRTDKVYEAYGFDRKQHEWAEEFKQKLIKLLKDDRFGFLNHSLLKQIEKESMIFDTDNTLEWLIERPTDKMSKEDMIAQHIAEIIVGHTLTDKRQEDVRKNIVNQFRYYIQYGKVTKDIPKRITKGIDFPKPSIFLSDDRKGLVWKFKKYCPTCMKLDNGCYCVDTETSITKRMRTTDHECWGCYITKVQRFLRKDYTNKYPKEACVDTAIEFLQYFEDHVRDGLPDNPNEKDKIKKWKKDYGKYFDFEFKEVEFDGEKEYEIHILHKKLTIEDANSLIDHINEFNSEGDYEPPDDSCSCPTWYGDEE